MATVRMSSGFHPGTEVKLVKRRAEEQHAAGGVVATGTVGEDSVLEIDNLDAGEYWAITEDQGTVQVHAKGDGESDRPDPTEFIDGPSDEAVIVSPPPATEVMDPSGDRSIAVQDRGKVIEEELTGVDPGNDDEDDDADDTAVSPAPEREVVNGPRTTATARPKRAARTPRS